MSLPVFSIFILSISFLIPITLITSDIVELSNIVIIFMIIFWVSMMLFDILFTINNKKFLKYESSFILGFFVQKTKLSYAIPLTILCEIGIIISSSFIFTHSWDIQVMAMIGMIVGIIHIDGLYKTRKFIISRNI